MSFPPEQPQIADSGSAFSVRVDSIRRDCVISTEALSKLSQLKPGAKTPMETFLAFEASINGVARRMVAARVPGTPMLLGPDSFR